VGDHNARFIWYQSQIAIEYGQAYRGGVGELFEGGEGWVGVVGALNVGEWRLVSFECVCAC